MTFCLHYNGKTTFWFHSCWNLNISMRITHPQLLRKRLGQMLLNMQILFGRFAVENYYSIFYFSEKVIIKLSRAYLFSSINNTFQDKADQGSGEHTFFQHEETLICFPPAEIFSQNAVVGWWARNFKLTREKYKFV